MLPSLASANQFAARLPDGTLSAADQARAEAALEDASALVRSEAGLTWVNDDNELTDVPDVVVTVTIAVARRAFVNPHMLAQESIQDYSTTFASTSSDIYLTRAERNAVRKAAGRSRLWTQATTRSDVAGDVPAVSPTDAIGSTLTEQLDPFAEGWTA